MNDVANIAAVEKELAAAGMLKALARPPISQATKAVDDTIETHDVQRWQHAVNSVLKVIEQNGGKEFGYGDAVAMVNVKKWLDNVYK